MKQRGLALRASKGFTLIELLVVIAIIGLLAAVILASLGGARSKGVDAAVKSQVNAARAQAELYAIGNGNKYTSACTALGSATPPGLAGILIAAGSPTGTATINTVAGTASTLTNVTCHDSATGWAISAPLSGGAAVWCVDSTGNAKSGGAGIIAANAVVCT